MFFLLQVSYYFQLAQQHQQSLQNNSSSSSGGQQQQSTQQQIQGQQQVVQSGVQTINVGQQQSQPQVRRMEIYIEDELDYITKHFISRLSSFSLSNSNRRPSHHRAVSRCENNRTRHSI